MHDFRSHVGIGPITEDLLLIDKINYTHASRCHKTSYFIHYDKDNKKYFVYALTKNKYNYIV